MKLIIDIPDNEYKQICELRLHNRTFYDDAIRKGIPLDEPFINKPCISQGVCREDKAKVLDKIRAEISDLDTYYDNDYFVGNKDAMFKCQEVLQIIDKYRKGEGE